MCHRLDVPVIPEETRAASDFSRETHTGGKVITLESLSWKTSWKTGEEIVMIDCGGKLTLLQPGGKHIMPSRDETLFELQKYPAKIPCQHWRSSSGSPRLHTSLNFGIEGGRSQPNTTRMGMCPTEADL